MTRFVIEITVDVWDYPHRDPRRWDLRGMAELAFGEEPDEVVQVSIREPTEAEQIVASQVEGRP